MENLFDILVPIVFFAVFVLSKLFGPKEDEQEGPQVPSPHPAHSVDTEEEERARLLREEIRRKIEQRRHEASQRAPSRAGERTAPVLARAQAEPPEEAAAHFNQAQIEQKMRRIEQLKQQAEKIRSGMNVPAPRSAYERSRRLAATDKNVTGSWQLGRGVGYQRGSASNGSRAAQQAYTMVRQPRSMRTAIILQEILGTPVGFRSMEDRSKGAVG